MLKMKNQKFLAQLLSSVLAFQTLSPIAFAANEVVENTVKTEYVCATLDTQITTTLENVLVTTLADGKTQICFPYEETMTKKIILFLAE